MKTNWLNWPWLKILPSILILVLVGAIFLYIFLPEKIECFGIVLPSEWQEIISPQTGKLLDDLPSDGTEVPAGKQLISLDTSELEEEFQILSLDTQRQTLSLLDQANEMRIQAQNSLLKKQRFIELVEQDRSLFSAGLIPRMDLDNREQSLITTNFEIESALTAAKSRQEEANILQNQYLIRNSIIDQIRQNRFWTTPFRGIVLFSRPQEQSVWGTTPRTLSGQTVKKGQLLGYFLNIESLFARIKIPESALHRIVMELSTKIYFSAFPNSKFPPTEGVLRKIWPSGELGYVWGLVEIKKPPPEISGSIIGTGVKVELFFNPVGVLERITGKY